MGPPYGRLGKKRRVYSRGVVGALPGVVDTRAGWLQGKEVVEVVFDSKVISYAQLLDSARCVEKPSTAFVYDAYRMPRRLELA